jgi:pimeloyl-ACP methyl ester carboxylesterase
MSGLYPEIDPYDHGLLDVGDGQLVYWETCGNPDGKPAVVLHGGPGSGCTPGWRRHFDPDVYRIARDWCDWEDSHVAVGPDHRPDPSYDDPVFRMCFARLVTHYWRHAGFLDDGVLLREIGKLAGIPGVLVHGALDVSSPLDVAWELSQAWPDSELVVIDDAGHFGPGMPEVLIAATDRFAEHHPSRP